MKSTLLDTKTAAERLNITVQQVRNLCRAGKLPAKQVAGTWVIRENEILGLSEKRCCSVAEDHAVYFSHKEISENKKPIALSFFSGAMGLDIGLEQAGFETLLACEVDKACRKTILKNKPKIALIGDIRDHSADAIRQAAGLSSDTDIDLVVGGPPCQAFSTAGKRKGFEDERGNVFLTYIDRIIALRPKYAIIENVRGILSAPLKHIPHNERGTERQSSAVDEMQGGALMYILQQLRMAGYSVSFNLYNSANFGTPQKRERVIIICSRDGRKAPYLEPTHSEAGIYGLPPWRTFREAVSGLAKTSHHHLAFPEKRLKYYRLLKPGQYWRHLPKELQQEALGASYFSGGGKTGFLRRLAWDEPSPTLVTHPAMPATDLAHPSEDRPLSIEEYKRLQEFPDSWIIEGNLLEQYRQIGNAVPISLGRAVGSLLLKCLHKEKITSFINFTYSRYINTDNVNWEKDFLKRQKDEEHQLALVV
jgi:DNA (cytosine-5)-methyltransferase 1